MTWGDYVTEPPLDEAVFLPAAREEAEARGEKPKSPQRNTLDWRRIPREVRLPVPLRPGDEPQTIVIPDSAAPMSPGGGLQLVVSAREIDAPGIDGVKRKLLAVSVFLVNSRQKPFERFRDLASCFQARLELHFPAGFEHRDDRASYDATDFDERLADLHYRDVFSYAVGHNTSGDWAAPDAAGRVTSVFTNPLPAQDVEKLEADIPLAGVERGMEALADAARSVTALGAALDGLPVAYEKWVQAQAVLVPGLEGIRRREVAKKCLNDVETARKRSRRGSPG